ncbi:hypothetical protein R1flu_015239 [Riccia fluitans]|uniref:Uncharacterized protein n=1 Tax=Riccia fluitans TaxID=41844 RepID=A0ABD1YIL7_9MARC
MRNSDVCWPVTLLPEHLEKTGRKDNSEPYRIRILSIVHERIWVPDGEKEETDDHHLLVGNLIHDLILCGTWRNDRSDRDVPIILMGHDISGILIKNLILRVQDECSRKHQAETSWADLEKMQTFLANLKAVMFFSTPHDDADFIDEIVREISEETQNQLLKLTRVLVKDLRRINIDFNRYRHDFRSLQHLCLETYALHPTRKSNRVSRSDTCSASFS